MYAPRTGGPGNWSPSPSPWVGAAPYPQQWSKDFRIVAYWGQRPEIQIREITWGKRGLVHSDSLVLKRFVVLDGRCGYCSDEHSTVEEAYDCAQEAAMLALILKRDGSKEKQDFIRIAKERGHSNG